LTLDKLTAGAMRHRIAKQGPESGPDVFVFKVEVVETFEVFRSRSTAPVSKTSLVPRPEANPSWEKERETYRERERDRWKKKDSEKERKRKRDRERDG
jgi:hypothetical protein